jgi:hypothetical protein
MRVAVSVVVNVPVTVAAVSEPPVSFKSLPLPARESDITSATPFVAVRASAWMTPTVVAAILLNRAYVPIKPNAATKIIIFLEEALIFLSLDDLLLADSPGFLFLFGANNAIGILPLSYQFS